MRFRNNMILFGRNEIKKLYKKKKKKMKKKKEKKKRKRRRKTQRRRKENKKKNKNVYEFEVSSPNNAANGSHFQKLQQILAIV